MAQYVGILDGSAGVWGVRIPDAPGCHGGGKTPADAIADAVSALREFAAHQQGKGITLSPPRRVHDIIRDKKADFDPQAGEAIVMVGVEHRGPWLCRRDCQDRHPWRAAVPARWPQP